MTASSIFPRPLKPAAWGLGRQVPDSAQYAQTPVAIDSEAIEALADTDMRLSPGQVIWLPAHAVAAISCLQGSLLVEVAADPHRPPLRLAPGGSPWPVTAPSTAWLCLRPWQVDGSGCRLYLHAAAPRTMLARMGHAIAQWIGWSAPAQS